MHIQEYAVEVCCTDHDSPILTTAAVRRGADGRLAITIDLGGHAISIAFFDTRLGLESKSSERPAIVGHHVGASYDPKPW